MRSPRIVILFISFLFCMVAFAAESSGPGVSPNIATHLNAIAFDSDTIYVSAYNNYLGGSIRGYSHNTYSLVSEVEQVSEFGIGDLEVFDNLLYSIDDDGVLNIFSLEPELTLLRNVTISNTSLMGFAIDADYIYIHDFLQRTTVWHRDNLSHVADIPQDQNIVRFKFDSDGDYLYGASSFSDLTNASLKKWDKPTWSVVESAVIGGALQGNAVIEAFYMDDEFVYTVVNDGKWTEYTLVEVWDKSDLSLHASIELDEIVTYLTADSKYVYMLVGRQGVVQVYNRSDLSLSNTITYSPYEILAKAETYGNNLFVSSVNGTLAVWDTTDFSRTSTMGEALSIATEHTVPEIDPSPIIFAVLFLLVISIFAPEGFLKAVRSRFDNVSVDDIFAIVIVCGVVMVAVSVYNPGMVSNLALSTGVEFGEYFDAFVRHGVIGYYWFLFWPVLGYWTFFRASKRKDITFLNNYPNKVASAASIGFLEIAYLLFFILP